MNIQLYQIVKVFVYVFSGMLLASCAMQKPDHPNVILIVTDDQGYGDLSCLGNPYFDTPNMDQLHAESVRFTNFHVDPTCAPTRSALMTGKYSHHAGVWHTVSGGNHLRPSEVTMADVFKQSGYQTAIFGKWHLGSNYPYRPMDRGFDEWLGQGDGGTGTTDDWFDNDRVNDYYWHNGQREQRKGFSTDVFYGAAMDYINKHSGDEQPFFIYLPSYMPHHPNTLPDTLMAANMPGEVSKEVAFFYASIRSIDNNIGLLRQTLTETGLDENTILIFMSDNGGTAGVRLYNAGMRGHKGQVYEGGHRVPFFVHWPKGKFANGKDVTDLTAHIDVLPTLIELCGLTAKKPTQFDGRSFAEQLYHPAQTLPERTLFVETQRTFKPVEWENTAGMTTRWRLVDNKELYDIIEDPGQTTNVFDQHPEVVQQIREAHRQYWALVTPGDREEPCFVVGHPDDPETYLTPSDWYLPEVPWNHAQVAKGSPFAGDWQMEVAQPGKYRFEVRRWPREADAAIQGVPDFSKKTVDAWSAGGAVERLIYGSEMKALPVHSIVLEVGGVRQEKQVNAGDKKLLFEVNLDAGKTRVKGTMLNEAGQLIAGAYYIYISSVE